MNIQINHQNLNILSIALFNEYDIKDKIIGKFISENICFNDFIERRLDSDIKAEKA